MAISRICIRTRTFMDIATHVDDEQQQQHVPTPESIDCLEHLSQKSIDCKMPSAQLTELSAEVLLVVADLLDANALLTLEHASRQLHALLRDVVEARCKRECFTTYLYATISTYRMLAPVPEVLHCARLHATWALVSVHCCHSLTSDARCVVSCLSLDVATTVPGVQQAPQRALVSVQDRGHVVVAARAQVGQPRVRGRHGRAVPLAVRSISHVAVRASCR